LGVPQGLTGASSGDPGVVSPFDPPFDADQLLLIGPGGQVTLQFPQPVAVNSEPAVGVFINAGIADHSFPNGIAGNPASTLGANQTPTVSVSTDGVNFVSLGTQTFNIPQNYYQNATGPYATSAPANPVLADYGQPFTGTLASFNGETFAQIVSTLDGSAGGNWLNLSGAGLSQINYIQFTEPATLPAGSKLALDAVSVSDADVPEPASASLVGGLSAIFLAIGRKRVKLAAAHERMGRR
jgi:hypothetical protein